MFIRAHIHVVQAHMMRFNTARLGRDGRLGVVRCVISQNMFACIQPRMLLYGFMVRWQMSSQSDVRWVTVHTNAVRAISTNSLASAHVLSVAEDGSLCVTDMLQAATTLHAETTSMCHHEDSALSSVRWLRNSAHVASFTLECGELCIFGIDAKWIDMLPTYP